MSSPYDCLTTCLSTSSPWPPSLSGMHPQTLRAYDRLGLVSPRPQRGGGRRYSMRDILALREIQRLSQEEGINLYGIKRILDLERELEQARLLAAQLHSEVAQVRTELEIEPARWPLGWPSYAGRLPTQRPRWCPYGRQRQVSRCGTRPRRTLAQPTGKVNKVSKGLQAMDDKLTRKSQEALSVSIRQAATDGNPQVEPVHLLLALLDAG